MRRLSATRLYYLMMGAHGLFYYIFATVNILYQVTAAHLNPLQLVLVGTVFEIAIFLFEVPTGVVADTISRRTSVIIGYFVFGAGLALQGLFPSFQFILLSAVIFGIGLTFLSGAREAWIADEAQGENVGHIFMRGTQFQQMGSFFGMILSVILAAIFQVNTPVVIGGLLLMGLGAFLILTMPEEHFRPAPSSERNTMKRMLMTFQEGMKVVRVKPILITILFIALIQGMASEGFDRLWLKHLNDEIVLACPLF
ncbi:MFS transporter [Candidatus Acetothermia bacterium]|nr:MFS transporter [Candidatus Acetothermia bacterium]